MAEKLIIDWKEYNLTTEKLAIQIYQSGFKPDILIGIMRGGAPIIDVLSRIFKLKCAYLAVESYSGKGIEDQQGELGRALEEMEDIINNLQNNIMNQETFDKGEKIYNKLLNHQKATKEKGKEKLWKTEEFNNNDLMKNNKTTNLNDKNTEVPIGVNCRTCDRMDCQQRAFPPIHKKFDIDLNKRGISVYVAD